MDTLAATQKALGCFYNKRKKNRWGNLQVDELVDEHMASEQM